VDDIGELVLSRSMLVSQRRLTDLLLVLSDRYDGLATIGFAKASFVITLGGLCCLRAPHLDCLTLNISSPHRFTKDHPGCRYDVSMFSRQCIGGLLGIKPLTGHEHRASAPSGAPDVFPKSRR